MTRNWFSKRELGNLGEQIASHWLQKNNYKILEKNFRTRLGEIDIIAEDKDYICFIEVKTRTKDTYGKPYEAITEFKKRRLQNLALYFLKTKGLNPNHCNIRFDVLSIELQDNNPVINLIKNAF